jgi:porphobilinogen deaminase
VQGRAGEDFSFLQGYSDREATVCALCERAFVRTLGGNCSTPVGAFAQVQDEKLVLHALYFDEETQKLHTGRLEGSVADPERTGRELAERFCAES